jgi:RNA 2',3'-cyclic 3'-phosphodiesterase
MRLFIGIPLAAATADAVVSVTNRLRAKISPDHLRWSAPESWHITLQFLGSARPEQYECITARLREVHHTPFAVQLGNLGTFGRAGILYADVHVTPELIALQQAVLASTAPCDFTPEDRPYHPHITLARRKGKSGGKELHQLKPETKQQPNLPGFTADSFLLYESFPTPDGSRYDVRERFSLRA